MKDILTDFIPHPPLVNKEFLIGSKAKFISEYETHLVQFIEWKRVWGELKDCDFKSFEKEFIETLAEYLIRKNDYNWKYTEEQTKKNQEEFINKTNTPVNEFEEAIYQYNHDLEEHIRLNTEYTDFLELRTPGDKEDAIDGEMRSYNQKIHYLSLRAYQLGFNAHFSEGIQFNEIEKEQTEEFLELSSKRAMDSARAKFIMLNELGIVDFLQDKLSYLPSESKLAKILSDITGEHQQHYLNGYKNKDGRNNPYREPKEGRENPVEIVKNRLRGYGVRLDE